MKVIVAGFSKTGTKSVAEALRQLGYGVYDFMEHYWEHGQFWFELFKKGKAAEDFKKLYENIDVVVDVPASHFWKEISEAFPDAKIILTIRDEDLVYNGLKKQFDYSHLSWPLWFAAVSCPTYRRFIRFTQTYTPFIYGAEYRSAWDGINSNKMALLNRFRQHNSYLIKTASKNKLLIFNVEQGWGPLCEFLNQEVPEAEFPWLNKDGKYVMETMIKHPFFYKLKKEFLVIISGVIVFMGIFMYFIFR